MLSYFSLPGPGGVSPSLGLSMCPPLPANNTHARINNTHVALPWNLPRAPK